MSMTVVVEVLEKTKLIVSAAVEEALRISIPSFHAAGNSVERKTMSATATPVASVHWACPNPPACREGGSTVQVPEKSTWLIAVPELPIWRFPETLEFPETESAPEVVVASPTPTPPEKKALPSEVPAAPPTDR